MRGFLVCFLAWVLGACMPQPGSFSPPLGQAQNTPPEQAPAAPLGKNSSPAAAPRLGAAAPVLRLRLIGQEIIPHSMTVDGMRVGGLSGLDYDAHAQVFYALSDDRSHYAPARFFSFTWAIGAQQVGAVHFLRAIALQSPQGATYPSLKTLRRAAPGAVAAHPVPEPVPDPEALRLDPKRQQLWWSSEGDRRASKPGSEMPPFVRRSSLSGGYTGKLPLPANLSAINHPQQGPRNNLALEGLALTPSGQLWLAMEASLQQDGDWGAAPARSRLTLIDPDTGQTLKQLAYPLDARGRQGLLGENGISDLLAYDERYLLVLERAFSFVSGFSARIYLADTASGSDVQQVFSLKNSSYQPMQKTLLLDFASSRLRPIGNLEGMSWGPRLPNGKRTLITVTDNNFSRLQLSQLAAFELQE